ncbi:mechanosensitive ion channel protein MscS [Devosia sp. Root436]|uniref:mechanosensitive ion channel domain-containing protein n=1 Tax=Devosia sp. Root436 TaxID=1736537 RepID=UPI0006F6DD68|nr:mechanosensitive ion channel domain-containing protein [Devosia sp. Root436]KQX35671.1 mechanosensitive ion channel protein MscS [Devosia sp. Root436]
MRHLLLLLLFVLSPVAAMAQVPGVIPAPAASSDPAIDELIRIIENDETRAALLERLKQTGTETPAPAEAPPDLSIVRQLAEYTKAAAEGTSATLRSLGQVFGDLQQGLSGTLDADLEAFRNVAIGVVLVAAGLFGSFLALRIVVLWAQGVIARRVGGHGWVSRIVGTLAAALVDFSSVLIAWAIGYAVALVLVGGATGRMGINQSLLLNAFLLVELSKLAARAILSPRFEALRLVRVGDDNAAYWSFWVARIISLLGYTFLFVTPLLAANLSAGAAAAVQVLVMATAVTIGIVIVLQNKDDVRTWLTGISARRGNDGTGQLLILLGSWWHVVAIIYLVTLLVVWFANPEQALPFMLGATLQSLVAILVGVVIVGFISRFVRAGLRLPDDIKARLPLLEARLQAFVPTVMQVVRWVVILGVLLAIAQAWALFDFVGWIGSEGGQQVAGSVISAALIILVCVVLHVVVASWVEYRLNTSIGKVPTAREKTLLNLFKNAFTIALVVFGLMLALAQVGVNIAPLLAGAGVVGLAIGFGAQKLVQDIITGIFIQFENVMNEGDVVAVGTTSGVVEKLTIRSVTIRDMSGTVHLIPFSSVDQVSNMVRGFSFYVAEFEVSRDSDIEEVKQAMRDAFAGVMETEHKDVILDDLDLQGLIAITPASMSLRARIKTLAGKQWGAGRLYSELVMRLFDERGIQTPTPRVSYVPGKGGTSLLP